MRIEIDLIHIQVLKNRQAVHRKLVANACKLRGINVASCTLVE